MNHSDHPYQLFSFAHCAAIQNNLNYLATKLMAGTNESWDYANTPSPYPFPILYSYIHYTFNKLKEEYDALPFEQKNRKIYISEECACFNTGLFTAKYEPIFAYFTKNRAENYQKWFLYGFLLESYSKLKTIPSLPKRADYFANPSALIYNYKLDIRIQYDHILDDERNLFRIPKAVRDKYSITALVNLFKGAVETTKKKLAANYKIAIPQYYNHEVQLLIPIDLEGAGRTDLALALSQQEGHYSGRTCLSLDMAYNNARLIVKPESDWLIP